MQWPKVIKDHTWQWVIGIVISITGIVITLLLSSNSNEIDPEELARKLAERLPSARALQDKEDETQALKATIKSLQKAPGDEFKQAARKALIKGDTTKATELLEKAVLVKWGRL